jgi:hypothetical protein
VPKNSRDRAASPPSPPASAQEQPTNTDRPLDTWDDDTLYRDPVDRAGVLSFPASDPPAWSGPA